MATRKPVTNNNGTLSELPNGDGLSADYLALRTDADVEVGVGELAWNAEQGTADLGLNSGGVVLQVGQESLFRVTNQSGSTIDKGTLVMAVGTVGSSGRILIAPWNGSQPSQTIMGLTTETIIDDGDGFVTHFGKLRGIDTTGAPYSESWSNGDILFAGASGGLTKTQPQAPNTKTIVALVINAHASVGELFIRPTFGSSLANDELVELTTLSNGQVIRYNSTNGRFENVTLTASDVGAYSDTNPSGFTSNAGTVTSVGLSVPTGLEVSNSPVTTSGTLTINYQTGYSIPTNAKQANWDTAFSWGDHATAGYLTSSAIGTSVLAFDSNLQSFVNTFTLPTTDGSSNQVLATNGSGVLSFVPAGTGTVTSIATNNGITGGTITTTGTLGLTGQALALHNLATNGIIARTGAGTVAGRTVTASTGISVANGDGVSGNPTITNTSPHIPTDLSYTASTRVLASSTGTNATLPQVTTTLDGLMIAADKVKLNGIETGAQVNVATNLTYSTAATTGTVNSSTGTNATIPAATTSLAGLMTNTDKTKLDGIESGAQVNVGTNLGVTAGTTEGAIITSSTGTSATLPTATASNSGVVTTGSQTWAGEKTFSDKVTFSNETTHGGTVNLPNLGTTNPASTINGDLWFRSNTLFFNNNGAARQVAHTGSWVVISEAAILAGTETTARFITAARLKYAFDNVEAATAQTAVRLATARTINGVAFDGTANITIESVYS
jgi:hypothetical protein